MNHAIQQKNVSTAPAAGASARKTFAAIDPFSAWQRQEEDNLIDNNPVNDLQKDETSADINAVDETVDSTTDGLPPPAEIKIFDETHHIEYRMVGGEIVPGIASTWTEVDEIYQEFRRSNLLTNPLRLGHSTVKAKNKLVNQLQKKLDDLDRQLRNPRIRNTDEESTLRGERY